MISKHSYRRIVVLLLAVCFGLGMSLSAVQASDMAVKMAISAGMDASGPSGCDACGDDDGSLKIGTCMPICMAAAFAVVPSGLLLKFLDRQQALAADQSMSRGRAADPEPYPPRPVNLG